jgi:steroid delta-isomerase
VEGRLALFADDVVVEDPATRRQATGIIEFREVLSGGFPPNWDLGFAFDRVAVVGDEAILTYVVTLCIADAPPAKLVVNAHVEFDRDGLIHRFRTFFDTASIVEASA